MAQARGSNAVFGFTKESTYNPSTLPTGGGTAGDNIFRNMFFINETLRSSRNLVSSTVLTPNRNPTMPVRGNIDVSGALNTELQAYFGGMLYATLGSATVVDNTTYHTHTFKIATALPSFTMEKGIVDSVGSKFFQYSGCKVNKFSMSLKAEGFQDCSFEMIGAKETVATTSLSSGTATTDYEDENPAGGKISFDGFSVGHIKVYAYGASNPPALLNIASIDNFSIENMLDGGQYAIGSGGYRVELPEGSVKVTGSVKAMFGSTDTLYALASNFTKSSIEIVYNLGNGGGTAGNESIKFIVPELYFGQNAPAIEGPNGIMVDLPFEAFYAAGSGASALQVELKNTQPLAYSDDDFWITPA